MATLFLFLHIVDMNKIFLSIGFLVCAGSLHAQESPGESILALRNISSFGITNAATQITPGTQVIGTPYLESEWIPADIVLTTGERLNRYPVRYNVLANLFEVNVLSDIKGLEGDRVTEFTLVSPTAAVRRFMAGKYYRQPGFYEILDTGQVTLLRRTDVIVKPPDYSPQFNVGSRDTRIIKKTALYTALNDDVQVLSQHARKFFRIFDTREDDVRAYAARNQLDLANEDHVVLIFRYYNHSL